MREVPAPSVPKGEAQSTGAQKPGTPTLTMELVQLSDLKANPKNPKHHPQSQILHIAASITRFGYLDPIVVNPQMVILDGHGRREALVHLGYTKVLVLVAHGLTKAQETSFSVGANKLALMTTIDQGKMRELLRTAYAQVDALDLGALGIEVSMKDILYMSGPDSAQQPPPSDQSSQPADRSRASTLTLTEVGKHIIVFDHAHEREALMNFLRSLETDANKNQTPTQRLLGHYAEHGTTVIERIDG